MLVYFSLQKSEALDNSLDVLDVVNLWVGGDERTNAQNLGFLGCIKVIWQRLYFRNCYYHKYTYKQELMISFDQGTFNCIVVPITPGVYLLCSTSE